VLTFLMAELYSSIVETVMDWAVAKKLEKRSKTVIFLSKIFINILLNY
jgi:ATP/ADP translocase